MFPALAGSEHCPAADNKKAIRGELGHKVASQLRIVPDIDFYLDTSLDYAEHIDELLRK